MAEKILKKFNVLNYNFSNRTKEEYDVLPYFRACWKDKSKYYKELRNEVTDKKTLKIWVKDRSRYMFWSRCEYEFLIAPWPCGSKKVSEDLEKILLKDFNIYDYKQNIDFWNIIIQDFYKIDIHEQIMMNIDIIVDILAQEFKIVK